MLTIKPLHGKPQAGFANLLGPFLSYLIECSYISQDLPLGLMDDIHDWSSRFSQRIDDLEEVCCSSVGYVRERAEISSSLISGMTPMLTSYW